MADKRLIINAHIGGLIASVGGYDAVCAYFEASTGRPYSKGTLSQKKNGTLDWTIMDMIMLQEMAGRAPVTAWLASLADEPDAVPCRKVVTAQYAIESGELVSASLAEPTPENRAKVHKEIADVRHWVDQVEDAWGSEQ